MTLIILYNNPVLQECDHDNHPKQPYPITLIYSIHRSVTTLPLSAGTSAQKSVCLSRVSRVLKVIAAILTPASSSP